MGRESYNKFRNIRTDGFASKREAAKAAELQVWQKVGAISELEFQVKYELIPKQEGESALSYVADFRYRDSKDGKIHVLDSKGMRTDVYTIKRKLMRWVYGIIIEEV